MEQNNILESDRLLEKTIAQCFEYRVSLTPDAPAVEFEGERISWNELDRLSDWLVWRFDFLGIKRGYTGAQLKKILDHSLRPVGMILLVIASGGVIRWMLQDSGLGDIIGPALEKSGMPLILVAFLIALLVRASVGSSMVAMTMASGIMATMPAVMATSMLYRAAMCCAICGGATALSHVNDAGFWLVGTFLEIDEKTTLKSWTIMETLIGITGGCKW